jgi:molybdopterin converting factor subunit 1
MNLKILAFGIAKDIVGGSTVELELNSTIPTVQDLKEKLAADYPSFKDLRSFAIAVNEEYAEDQQTIAASDEVVIIPPVSGG